MVSRLLFLDGIIDAISGVFSGIANWISDKIGQWVDYLIYTLLKFVYEILKIFFLLLDFIQMVFRKMAGLDTVYIDGQAWSQDLALMFFRNENVINALISLMVVAVVLIFATTFIAIIRNHYNAREAKDTAIGPVVGRAFKALFTFIFVPLVCYFGVYVSNGLLKTVDQATRLSNALTISGEVFVASGMNANRARIDSDFNLKLQGDASLNFNGAFKEDSNQNYTNSQDSADKIDEAFASKLEANGHNVQASSDDYSYMFHQASPGNINNWDYMNTDLVFIYYDFLKYNWLFAFVSCFFIMATLLVAALGVIQRLFEITILFAISPPFIALMPLDEGRAYKNWAGKFIGNVLIMYGTVVALNFFFIIAPILQTVDLFGSPQEIEAYGELTCALFNAIAHILFIMCGAMMIKDFTNLVNSLVTDKTASLEDRGRGVQGSIQNTIGKGQELWRQTGGRAHQAYNNYFSDEKVQERQKKRDQRKADRAAGKQERLENRARRRTVMAGVRSGQISLREAGRFNRELRDEQRIKRDGADAKLSALTRLHKGWDSLTGQTTDQISAEGHQHLDSMRTAMNERADVYTSGGVQAARQGVPGKIHQIKRYKAARNATTAPTKAYKSGGTKRKDAINKLKQDVKDLDELQSLFDENNSTEFLNKDSGLLTNREKQNRQDLESGRSSGIYVAGKGILDKSEYNDYLLETYHDDYQKRLEQKTSRAKAKLKQRKNISKQR